VRLRRSGRGQAPASARCCGGDWRSPPLPQRAVGQIGAYPILSGKESIGRSTEKLVRTIPSHRYPTGRACQSENPVGASETSPRLGVGVVMLLSYFLVSHTGRLTKHLPNIPDFGYSEYARSWIRHTKPLFQHKNRSHARTVAS